MPRHLQLPGIKVFATLSADARRDLFSVMYLRSYRKGSLLFAQGEVPSAIYFVESGRVKWHKVSEDGCEQTLQVVETGEAVGMVALLDRKPYIANAEAIEDAMVWVLSVADFDKMVLRHPEVALHIMSLLGDSVRWLLEHVHAMTTRSAQDRVVAVLVRKAVTTDTGHQVVPLTHQEIAHLGGMARETVSRVLADLQRRGAVRLTRSAIIVVDTSLFWSAQAQYQAKFG